jgi:hypothetical protein
MVNSYKTAAAIASIMIFTAGILAQRPRTAAQDSTPETTNMPAPPPAPATVKAKYDGGVFGYPHKMDGKINFEDSNERLVFRNEKQKELFPLPYKAITGAYGDTHAVRPKAASIGSVVPYFGLPIGLIKTKVRYLTVQYRDPDSNVSGVTSFRLENKDILDSVLYTLAQKAGLSRRGEIFIKKKP